MRKLSNMKILACSLFLAVLAFSLLPIIVAGEEGKFENEDASVVWSTQVSKESVIVGEQFSATIDLVATIRQIPGGTYGTMIKLVNRLPARATISYDVVGIRANSDKEIFLGSYEISKSLPKLEEGATLDFRDEKVPTDGYLMFPEAAEYGGYTLYIRFTRVEAKISPLPTQNITEMIRKYLPPQSFDPGIELAEIELISAPPSGITPLRVIALSPYSDATGVAIDTAVSVSFSEAVEKSSAEAAFYISPSVRGKFSWMENVLTFIPNKKLSHGTAYKVTIGKTVRDLTGTSLAAEFEGSFTTQSKPSRWWIWPIVGVVAVVGVLVYFLLIRNRGKTIGQPEK